MVQHHEGLVVLSHLSQMERGDRRWNLSHILQLAQVPALSGAFIKWRMNIEAELNVLAAFICPTWLLDGLHMKRRPVEHILPANPSQPLVLFRASTEIRRKDNALFG